jgi:hypothetical protein
LPPREVQDLSLKMREQERLFREALYEVPGTAIAVLERWTQRRAQGLVTGMLCHRYRDDPGTDWTGFIDEVMRSLSQLVERREKMDSMATPAQRTYGSRSCATSPWSSEPCSRTSLRARPGEGASSFASAPVECVPRSSGHGVRWPGATARDRLSLPTTCAWWSTSRSAIRARAFRFPT